MDWLSYYIGIAHAVAKKSKDPHKKCGHIIVNPAGAIVSTGYNSFPRGINDYVPERSERPEKYKWIEHSERNAIYNAARHGISTEGCDMYGTTSIPCCDCARAIINAGIKTLYVEKEAEHSWRNWKEDMSRSRRMLAEAGVRVCEYIAEDCSEGGYRLKPGSFGPYATLYEEAALTGEVSDIEDSGHRNKMRAWLRNRLRFMEGKLYKMTKSQKVACARAMHIWDLIVLQDFKCSICEGDLKIDWNDKDPGPGPNVHLEHSTPQDAEDEYRGHIHERENCTASCPRCNLKKGTTRADTAP